MFNHAGTALFWGIRGNGHGRAFDDLRRLDFFSFRFLVLVEVDVELAGKGDIGLLVLLPLLVLFHCLSALVVLLVDYLAFEVSLVYLVLNALDFLFQVSHLPFFVFQLDFMGLLPLPFDF